jgi:acyl-CoA thioester hydrolase
MGLVHHSNYLKYMEIGRTDLLRAAGGCYRDMEAAGMLVVVARIDCKYRSPAKYDDVITITTQVVKVTAAKIIHEYQIRRDEQLLIEATVTLAVIDRNGQLQRVPQSVLDFYGIVL